MLLPFVKFVLETLVDRLIFIKLAVPWCPIVRIGSVVLRSVDFGRF